MPDKERLQLNIRMDGQQALHEAVKAAATRQNTSVNAFIIDTLKAAVGMATEQTQQQILDEPLDKTLAILEEKLDTLLDNKLAGAISYAGQNAIALPSLEVVNEVIDRKTAYLGTAINHTKEELAQTLDSLLAQVEILKNRVDELEQREAAIRSIPTPQSTAGALAPNPQTDTQPEAVTEGKNIVIQYICPKCGVVGQKGKDFTSKGENSVGNKRLRCIHCNTVRVESTFLENKKF